MNARDERLVRTWIRIQRDWWAWEEIERAGRKSPQRAWRLLGRLSELATTATLIRDVGAGPLEDFIRDHAPRFIGEIERRALRQPRFRRALRSVRLPMARDQVSARLFALGVEPVKTDTHAKWQKR
jgi:hypothetical protein